MKLYPKRTLGLFAALLAVSCGMLLLCPAGYAPADGYAAVAAFAAAGTEEIGGASASAAPDRTPVATDASDPFSLFWVATDAPTDVPTATPNESPSPAHSAGFTLEVLSPAASAPPPKRVLIYHTHTYEAYEQDALSPYRETEKWRTADNDHNVARVGAELAALLRAVGLEVTHDATAFEPPNLSGAYARSLDMLAARLAAGERYDLLIDLHRDAYVAAQTGANAVTIGGTEAARLMLLVGKGEGQTAQGFAERPDWERNLALAQAVTDALNAQADGLCKDVRVKSGRFNQHVHDQCLLVEAGNNRNTLAQALAAMPYLADAIAGVLLAN